MIHNLQEELSCNSCLDPSQAEADAEYRSGISEMQHCLAKGVSVDDLWRVAHGEIKFVDFRQNNGLTVAAPPPPPPAPSPSAEPSSDVAPPVAEQTLEAPIPAKEVEIGEGRGMMQRDYLDLIKVCPVLYLLHWLHFSKNTQGNQNSRIYSYV